MLLSIEASRNAGKTFRATSAPSAPLFPYLPPPPRLFRAPHPAPMTRIMCYTLVVVMGTRCLIRRAKKGSHSQTRRLVPLLLQYTNVPPNWNRNPKAFQLEVYIVIHPFTDKSLTETCNVFTDRHSRQPRIPEEVRPRRMPAQGPGRRAPAHLARIHPYDARC